MAAHDRQTRVCEQMPCVDACRAVPTNPLSPDASDALTPAPLSFRPESMMTSFVRGYLPAAPGPLIGREALLASVTARLHRPDVRLLTLTGPGGIGKTRLALAAATAASAAWPDGIWFVDLAPLRAAAQVLPAIAHALGVREAPGVQWLSRLQMALADQSLLVVLDNCEQVLAAAPDLAALLSVCPHLMLLATSRVPLHLRWEHCCPVPPLAVPTPADTTDLTRLAAVPAVACFLDRLRASGATVALTTASAPAIAALCARLDGWPLALELAAARARLLGPETLLAHLNARFTWLTTGARDLPDRHQSLAATLDWSYALMSPAGQALCRGSAVFVGGGSLAALRAVAAPDLADAAVLAALTELADHQFLTITETAAGVSRFWQLETLRAYAMRWLTQAGEDAAARARHAAYYVAHAEALALLARGPEQARWLDEFAADEGNVEAALTSLLTLEDSASALRLAAACWPYWYVRGELTTGRALLTAVLDASATAPATLGTLRAAVLTGAGCLAYDQGDLRQASAWFTEGIVLYRQMDDRGGLAFALSRAGALAYHTGDVHQARTMYAESLALRRALTSPRDLAFTLIWLAVCDDALGAVTEAAAGLAEGLALLRTLGEPWALAFGLRWLGVLAARHGRRTRAVSVLRESLVLRHDIGDRVGLAECLADLACLLSARALPRAALLWQAAQNLWTAAGARPAPADETRYVLLQERLAAHAQEPTLVAAVAQATELPLTTIVALAQGEIPPQVSSPARSIQPLVTLTSREREVAMLVADGLTNPAIAARLGLGERTVHTHVGNLLRKLGFTRRTQVAAWVAAQPGRADNHDPNI